MPLWVVPQMSIKMHPQIVSTLPMTIVLLNLVKVLFVKMKHVFVIDNRVSQLQLVNVVCFENENT